MNRRLRLCASCFIVAALMISAQPALALAGAAGLNLTNNTGETMTALFIRRTGTQSWLPLPATPPRPGRGARATSPFTDPDCAFDIKATLEDSKVVVWPGVILCEVKSVTLNRNASGATWVDYD